MFYNPCNLKKTKILCWFHILCDPKPDLQKGAFHFIVTHATAHLSCQMPVLDTRACSVSFPFNRYHSSYSSSCLTSIRIQNGSPFKLYAGLDGKPTKIWGKLSSLRRKAGTFCNSKFAPCTTQRIIKEVTKFWGVNLFFDNIKMNPKEENGGQWTGITCLRTGNSTSVKYDWVLVFLDPR